MPVPVQQGQFRIFDHAMQTETSHRVSPVIGGQPISVLRLGWIGDLRKRGLLPARSHRRNSERVRISIEPPPTKSEQVNRTGYIMLSGVTSVGVVDARIERLPGWSPNPLDEITLKGSQLRQVQDRMDHQERKA